MDITLKKGLDLDLPGRPEQSLHAALPVSSVALLGADYVGLKPRLLVAPGDRVSLGQPLFHDKHDPQVQYTAPGSGSVRAVHRGERRVLQSVVIALDENTGEEKSFAAFDSRELASLAEDTVRDILYASGLWTALRTRPYNRVPHSSTRPQALFVTAIDTQPLAADPQVVIEQQNEAFHHGLRVLARLTPGPLYLCSARNSRITPPGDIEGLQTVGFSGPHPAGLPGTHIHHLFPVSAARCVWHIGYQDVIAIGRLFTNGRIDCSRVVALGGPMISQPRLLQTRQGAAIADLLAGERCHTTDDDTAECLSDGEAGRCRIISGSVLNGHSASGALAYLGRYHQQISVIREGSRRRRLFGWLRGPAGDDTFSTARHGRATAMVPGADFERVMPLDILPVPLLRALLVRDTAQAQDLGCLELAEEDLALCAYVCPAKYDYGAALRTNLDQIEREG